MAGGADTARLSPAGRSAALAALAAAEFQVLVVGGGVVGTGTALDAVTRGLSVGLVEARDFGSGTSSRSSKLIHGGLRYLEHLQFDVVRESLRDRAAFVWSLSKLTFLHEWARMIALEQLYRAATILAGHPYHRG